MLQWIDTHGHVNAGAFNDDWKEVLQRTHDAHTWVVMPGFQHPTSQKAVDMSEKYSEGVYAALGFHPTHVGETRNIFDVSAFERLLPHPKIVAIGETGLDYYHIDKARTEVLKQEQATVLRAHIDLATQYTLPLIIHCRDAYEDLLVILKEAINEGKMPKRGVIHCYVGDWEIAQQFLALGFLISFTGIITFTKDDALLDVVRHIPIDKFMVETDTPYLSPVPYRGKQNEPLRVRYIGEKVAELKNISVDTVATQTTKTARAFFGI